MRSKYSKNFHVSDGHDAARRQLYTRRASIKRVTDDEFTTSEGMLHLRLANFKGDSRKAKSAAQKLSWLREEMRYEVQDITGVVMLNDYIPLSSIRGKVVKIGDAHRAPRSCS